jgi:cytochrome oxidase assembly protein ShyY1
MMLGKGIRYAKLSCGWRCAAPPAKSKGFPERPNDHLSYAINWFCPGQIEAIMFALRARKALKP